MKLQDATVDVERLGELFLINREQMVVTDKQRNSTREALTALRKRHLDSKVWISNSSNSFSRCSRDAAVSSLEAGELQLLWCSCCTPMKAWYCAHKRSDAPAFTCDRFCQAPQAAHHAKQMQDLL